MLNGYIEFIRVFVDSNQYFFAIYINLGQHLITLICCKILHNVNKQKYKSLAYKSSLSERHQECRVQWLCIICFTIFHFYL
uniref:Ovule protein n=1 Tax=Panagrolaimus superbus TaxID=310955 RepID=A0A914Z871_9BILA